MNICFFTHFIPNPQIGGVERVTYNLCNYFRKLGLEVYNLTSFGDDQNSIIPQDKSDIEKITFINDYLSRNKIDVLIDQYGNEPLLEHPYVQDNVKIINCYHLTPECKHLCRRLLETFSFRELKSSLFNLACLLNTPRRNYFFKRLIKRKTNGGVDKMVYLSPNYIPFVRRLSNSSAHILTSIPNAAEESLLLRSSENHVNKRKTIIWCGRIVHSQKNVLFLPRLWSRLEKKHPEWNLVIVGDGIDRKVLERRIKKYGLESITITGYTDPYPYYESAAISITPSFFEGFPMVLIEAMAFGCVPIVFDNTASYSDVIESGRDGIIVPDMDEDAFVDACDKLMTEESLRQEMALNAKEKVKKFSIDKVSKQWISLFEELTKHNN